MKTSAAFSLTALPLAISLAVASTTQAKTQKGRLPSLKDQIQGIISTGQPETMPAIAGKDLGITGDQKLKTFTVGESSGPLHVERALSVAYDGAGNKTTPMFLTWSITHTNAASGNTTYDIWTFKTDLSGRVQAAAHGGGDDQHVSQSPYPLNDESLRIFEDLKRGLVGPDSSHRSRK